MGEGDTLLTSRILPAAMTLRAFVTGGTGFVGRRVVRRLLDAGWKVRALVLESERNRLPEDANLEPAVGDVTRPETIRGLITTSMASSISPPSWNRGSASPKNSLG